MRGSDARRSNYLVLTVILGVLSAVIGSWPVSAPVFAQESMVNAIICGDAATISVSEPTSDSVVTNPSVTVKGNVTQASQIVIEIDGAYDGVIPLTVGQLKYEAPIQLSSGTHTIKLTAIDSCGSSNADISTVVTFTSPPSQSSDGSSIATGVNNGGGSGGVTISSADGSTVEQKSEGGILPAPVAAAVNNVLQWLNIAPTDTSVQSEGPKLSVVRALTIALGTYTATIGLAAVIVTNVASTPLFYQFEMKKRYLVASRVLRVLGVLLVLGGFFL